MNYIGKMKTFWVLAVAFLATAVMSDAQAQQARAGKAEVRVLRGSAKYSQGGGIWAPLKVGTVLRSGSVVQTGPETVVDFFLGDNGPVVRMTSDTQLAFDKLAIMGGGVENVIDTQLNISNGRILGNVKKLAAASKYTIKTPTGQAGVRGTDFEVTVTVRGTEYVVTYTSVNGQLVAQATVNNVQVTKTINTGESWTPGATPDPVKLSDAQLTDLRNQMSTAIGAELDRQATLPTQDIINRQSPGTGGTGTGGT